MSLLSTIIGTIGSVVGPVLGVAQNANAHNTSGTNYNFADKDEDVAPADYGNWWIWAIVLTVLLAGTGIFIYKRKKRKRNG